MVEHVLIGNGGDDAAGGGTNAAICRQGSACYRRGERDRPGDGAAISERRGNRPGGRSERSRTGERLAAPPGGRRGGADLPGGRQFGGGGAGHVGGGTGLAASFGCPDQ